MTHSKGIKYEQISIVETFDVKRNSHPIYYAFNFVGGGFVIVAADDAFTPIIGYDAENFYSERDASDSWKWLMNEYAEMIDFSRKQKMEGNLKYASMWEHLTSSTLQVRTEKNVTVEPLCSALWNQNYPYNYYAPSDAKGRAYAGCVATAMSIIMHYWRWPLQGTGQHSYYPSADFCYGHDYPEQTANFGETEYRFDGMTNSAREVVNEPIALLMYHCGVAVDMMYCHSGSGAYSVDVPWAIKQFFKYDESAEIHDRYFYDDDEWITLLKTDLDKGYPMYYSGCSNSGCHAFVCDGYNSDNLFHFNFGWGGSQNGYYTAEKAGDFSSAQSVITNFIPDQSQYPADCSEYSIVPFSTGIIADCSGPIQNYKQGVSSSWLINPGAGGDLSKKTIIINWEEFDLAQGDYLRIYDGENAEKNMLLAEYTKGTTPEEIFSTREKVLVQFVTSSDSETAKGFKLNFKINAVEHCEDGLITALTESTGTFDDGSGENYYYSNLSSCQWKIEPENAKQIHINFNYFETEDGNDMVKIYDMEKGALIVALSGKYEKNNLPEVIVPSGKALVSFRSNNVINAKGFEISYATSFITGIDEQNKVINAISVFPNPTSEILNVSFGVSGKDNIRVEIFNTTGQYLYRESLSDFNGKYKNGIYLGTFSEGIYFLRVTSENNGTFVKKIIVQ